MEGEAVSQFKGPREIVRALGPTFDHLRLGLELAVLGEKHVIDHVAMTGGGAGCSEDWVQHPQVAVRHHAKDLLLGQGRCSGHGQECRKRGAGDRNRSFCN